VNQSTRPTPNRKGLGTTSLFVSLIVIIFVVFAYLSFTANGGVVTTQDSSTTTNSGMQGVVTGYVTVGPSRPVCSANQTCNVDLTGYSLVFTSRCQGGAYECGTSKAVLSPGGHYSILLPGGSYSVTGMYPSCSWIGCASAFPKTVLVEGGMQVVLDFNIDTGIR